MVAADRFIQTNDQPITLAPAGDIVRRVGDDFGGMRQERDNRREFAIPAQRKRSRANRILQIPCGHGERGGHGPPQAQRQPGAQRAVLTFPELRTLVRLLSVSAK